MANATLGASYGNLTQGGLADTYITKAFDLKERASERERLYISSHYYDIVTEDIDKAIEVYEQWVRLYPRDTAPRDNLSLRYAAIGQQEGWRGRVWTDFTRPVPSFRILLPRVGEPRSMHTKGPLANYPLLSR